VTARVAVDAAALRRLDALSVDPTAGLPETAAEVRAAMLAVMDSAAALPDVTELQILAFAYAEAHASYRMVPCDAYSRARAAALGDLLAAVCGQEVAP